MTPRSTASWFSALRSGLGTDVRLAWRGLKRRPGFFVLVVSVLACGLGSAMAGFAMYEAHALKAVPFPEPDALVQVALAHDSRPLEAESFFRQDLQRVAERTDVFQAVSAFRTSSASVSDSTRPERLDVGLVGPSLFPLLGISPMLGRTFAAADAAPGAPLVVMLSETLWRQRYGADPGIVGRTIRVDLRPRTVIGVMPPGFAFPYRQQAWLPLVDVRDGDANDTSRAIGVGRLRAGATVAHAEAAATRVVADAAANTPDRYQGYRLRLQPLSWFFVDWQARDSQRLLLVAVAALLVLALANAAGLLLTHLRAREAEWHVRATLGAGGAGRVAGGLSVAGIVGLTSLAVAVPCAHVALVWLEGQIWQAEDPSPYFLHLILTPGALAVGAGAVLALIVLGGLLPTLLPAGGALRPGAASTRMVGSRPAARLTGGLVALQMALSLMIVVVLSVLLQAVQGMALRDLGVGERNLLTARVSLPAERYADDAARETYWRRLTDALRDLPGGLAATVATTVPGYDGDVDTIRAEGAEPGRDLFRASWGLVDRHFLSTYGATLRAGRDVTDRDTGAPVAIVDRRFAASAWPGREAVGRRFRIDGPESPWAEVIGVVDDMHLAQVDDPPRPSVLLSRYSRPPLVATLAVRTSGSPYDALADVQAVVAGLDPDVPLSAVRSLNDAIAHGHSMIRIAVRLLTWLGVCGLLVAAAGLYALLAVRVTERTKEIGVRRAVGAGPGAVARAVVSQVATPLVGGTLAGSALAWPVAQRLVALEPTVLAVGPASMGWAGVALALAVVLAMAAPLLRALAIDPMVALRDV